MANLNNYILINNLNVSTISGTYTRELLDLTINRVEVQIDWSGLTGTLDANIQIQQRMAIGMNYTCVDVESLLKIMDTSSGSFTFLMYQWTAQAMNILINKNGCTGGTINVGVGIRR